METAINAKQNIIDTTVSMIKQKGFDNVKIVDICKETGITRTTFYYHFQSKEEIIEAYFQDRILEQEHVFSELFQLENDLERYCAIVEKLVSMFLEEGPTFGKQILCSILDDPHILNTFLIKDDWCIPLLNNCQRNHLIRTDLTPEELDQIIVNLTLGTSFHWCATGGSFDLIETIQSSVRNVLRT